MNSQKKYKYLILLIVMHVSILLVSVLLDYKFISIGNMVASSATFIISLTFFISDIIAEVYGYEIAKQVLLSSILGLIIFISFGLLLNSFKTPIVYIHYANAYKVIFNLLLRSGVSNVIALLAGLFFNIYLVSKWKIALKGRYFWLRSLGSSAVGEAIYTIFVVSLVNIGLVPFVHFFEILIISYCFKLLFDFFTIVPANMLANFLKRVEGVEYNYIDEITFPLRKEKIQWETK